MNRIDTTFRRLRREGRGALIPFLMAGDPDPETSLRLALAACRGGADILELGVPFSDPVADGPVIQRAGQRALAAGTTVGTVLDLVRRLRGETDTPVVLMTYWNPLFQRGPERFAREAAEAGADGVIVVDLTPEEGRDFFAAARRAGLATILLTAPTTTPRREAALARGSSGFVYCVSRRGTTGARDEVPTSLRGAVERLRGFTRLPLAVGFGLSTREQVKEVLSVADGAVVGSALVRAAEDAPPEGKAEAVGRFLASLL